MERTIRNNFIERGYELVDSHSHAGFGATAGVDSVEGVLVVSVGVVCGAEDELAEAVAEVDCAEDGVGDGDEEEEDGDDGERGEGFSGGHVLVFLAGLVHADEFEEEPQYEDCGGDDGDGEGELDVTCVQHNHRELDRKAQEEEEVELDQRHKHQIGHVPSLQPQVRPDVFVERPAKLAIKAIGEAAHQHKRDRDHARDRDRDRAHHVPVAVCGVVVAVLREGRDRARDLVVLQTGVDEHGEGEEVEPHDLDRVLMAERVEREHALVELCEDEQGEICRDRS
ncbi:hypothetical protein TRICI_006568 [Trichomonascus ciferrii]|uniref:Uncharacterized protein n=1 Tax=Trichomonascus ciferrii TaxID=44093 RepID=A0A642UG70_9ASCO|nr:hypothetical protein TRICI_006568 [Trichomonascus ciferrii]